MRKRVVAVLTIRDSKLVKTQKYLTETYLGDPINAVRLFNEKNVDELILLNISNNRNLNSIDFTLLENIANESNMPLAYGGGIKNINDAIEILKLGYEKLVFNTLFFENRNLISDLVKIVGSQSVVICLDYRIVNGLVVCFSRSGNKLEDLPFIDCIQLANDLGVGEIILSNIEKDGTREGYDLEAMSIALNLANCPIVLMGGASSYTEIMNLLNNSEIQACAAGHLFSFFNTNNSVLINYPNFSYDYVRKEFIENG
jgi:imidazole glycerol-phosphate synthase subunit HisF